MDEINDHHSKILKLSIECLPKIQDSKDIPRSYPSNHEIARSWVHGQENTNILSKLICSLFNKKYHG